MLYSLKYAFPHTQAFGHPQNKWFMLFIVQDVIRFGTLALHSLFGGDDKYSKCRGVLELYENEKRGSGAPWGPSKNTDSIKNGNFFRFFSHESIYMKGRAKGGAQFLSIDSDSI